MGYVTATLNALGYNCIGVDISPIAIERARENFPSSKFYLFDELMKMEEKNSLRFDFIYGLDVLEHLDNFQVINHYLDILNQDGYIAFSVPQSCQYIWHGEFPPVHLSLWNKTSISVLYKNLGLKPIFFYENKPISSIGSYTIRKFLEKNIDIISGRNLLQTDLNEYIKLNSNKNNNLKIIKIVKKILPLAIGTVSYPIYVNKVNGSILFAIAQKIRMHEKSEVIL